MQLTHSIALDFGRDTLPITIFAKQYDKESRFVEIVPLECGKDYTLESGVTARLQLTKPDGHTVLKTATIANGVIKVELTEQTLAVAGTAVAEIGLYKGNSLLSSQIFYIEIKDGQVHVEPYEYYDRNAILTVNATNFTKLINGKLDPVIAFTTGKLKVDGDVNAALELIKFIK